MGNEFSTQPEENNQMHQNNQIRGNELASPKMASTAYPNNHVNQVPLQVRPDRRNEQDNSFQQNIPQNTHNSSLQTSPSQPKNLQSGPSPNALGVAGKTTAHFGQTDFDPQNYQSSEQNSPQKPNQSLKDSPTHQNLQHNTSNISNHNQQYTNPNIFNASHNQSQLSYHNNSTRIDERQLQAINKALVSQNPNEQRDSWLPSKNQKDEIIDALMSPKYKESVLKDQKIGKEESQNFVDHLLEKGREIQVRNQRLVDERAEQQMRQCTFQPNNYKFYEANDEGDQRSYPPSRSISQFLDEQVRFVENQQRNLDRIRHYIDADSNQKLTHKPEINPNSQLIIDHLKSRTGDAKVPAFKRLYELSKKNEPIKEVKRTSQVYEQRLNSPEAIRIQEDAADRLYKDAERRKIEGFQKSRNSSKPNLIPNSKKNDFCLASKLVKEFEIAVEAVAQEQLKQSNMLDYLVISEVLRRMGFISFTEQVQSLNFVAERALVNDIWIMFQGPQQGGISFRNLLYFLLAVSGLVIDLPKMKRDTPFASPHQGRSPMNNQNRARPLNPDYTLMKQDHNYENQEEQYFEPGVPMSQMQMNQGMRDYLNQRSREMKIGKFDIEGNLVLEQFQIKQIQNHFQIFYLNRLHLGDQLRKENFNSTTSNPGSTLGNGAKTRQSDLVVVPMVSPQTERLAENHINKVLDITRAANIQIGNPHPNQRDVNLIRREDILIAHKLIKEQQTQYLRDQKSEQELGQCTFHPKTISTNSHQSNVQGNNNNNKTIGFSSLQSPKNPSDRHLHLYNLAKPRGQFRDKQTQDIEYEKNCDECTFNPDLNSTKNFQNQSKQSLFKASIPVKQQDEAVNRLRKGWELRENFQKCTERGELTIQERKQSRSALNSNNVSRQHAAPHQNSNHNQYPNDYSPYSNNQDYTPFSQNKFSNLNSPHSPQFENHDPSYNDSKYERPYNEISKLSHSPNIGNEYSNPLQNYDSNLLNQSPENNYYDHIIKQQNNIPPNHPQYGPPQSHDQNYGLQNFPPQSTRDNYPTQAKNQPLLYVDVNLGGNRVERIVVYEGDRPDELADNFLRHHGIDSSVKPKLIQMLEAQIQSLLN